MTEIQYLLFDLDGTLYNGGQDMLVDLRSRIAHWLSQALGIPEFEASALGEKYYSSYGSTLTGLLKHHPELDPEDYLIYIHQVPIETYLIPNPALGLMLEQFSKPKVIFTNSIREWSERVLNSLGIRRHFERIIDIRNLNYLSKPIPSTFQQVLSILDVPGSACVLIDDQPRNLQRASDLGMRTILVHDALKTAAGIEFAARNILDVGPVLKSLLG
ncbi:MAG: pyrimidine 5'-nucleotidase [Anaerolineae bacterium]|nr:pyrimidine 5'-nucleotidase [Anaerolineae bacterium]